MPDPADDLDLDLIGELSDGALEALADLLIASNTEFTPATASPAVADHT